MQEQAGGSRRLRRLTGARLCAGVMLAASAGSQHAPPDQDIRHAHVVVEVVGQPARQQGAGGVGNEGQHADGAGGLDVKIQLWEATRIMRADRQAGHVAVELQGKPMMLPVKAGGREGGLRKEGRKEGDSVRRCSPVTRYCTT